MIAVDPAMQIIGWEPLCRTAARATRAEEALGRPCHEVLAWTDRCGNAVWDENVHLRCAEARRRDHRGPGGHRPLRIGAQPVAQRHHHRPPLEMQGEAGWCT